MARIVKTYRFEAAHRLPNHDGQCARPHGHSYIVEVAVEGTVRAADGSAKEGMVIDFGDVSEAFQRRVMPLCDHQNLNETLPIVVTTAEQIADWILAIMCEEINPDTFGCVVAGVRVWETTTGYAEVGKW